MLEGNANDVQKIMKNVHAVHVIFAVCHEYTSVDAFALTLYLNYSHK